MNMSVSAFKDIHATYIEIKKPKDAFVSQYKESIACRLVNDRKSMNMVLMKHVDRFKKTRLWIDEDNWLRVFLQNF